MVPLKLALKNFLSYGQTTQQIDFEPYNLICLSGKNGHGKSALLDAVTWALWGHARKVNTGARADENLIRLGQTQMMVSCEFMCNNAIYRVRRELSVSAAKTQTTLDFGVVDPQTQQIRGLTDKTVRATQEKITATIGLDYESFINSVFLRQGHANEFSKKSPKERKEILTAILGISQFELIKKRAIEKSRYAATEKDILLPLQHRLLNDINQKQTLQDALAQATTQEHALAQRLKQLLAHRGLQEKLTAAYAGLAQARIEFKKIIQQKMILKQTPTYDIKALEHELEQLRSHELAALALEQENLRIAQQLHERQTVLTTQHIQRMHAHELLMQQTLSRIQINQTRLAQITQKTKPVPAHARDYERYRERYQEWVTKKNSRLILIQEDEQRINLLQKTTQPECPTCDQALNEQQKTRLCDEQLAIIHKNRHQVARLQRLLPPFKQLVIDLHATLETVKANTQLAQEHQQINQELLADQHKHTLNQQEKQALTLQHEQLTTHDTLYQDIMRKQQELEQRKRAMPPHDQTRKDQITALLKQAHQQEQLPLPALTMLSEQLKTTIHATCVQIKLLKKEALTLNYTGTETEEQIIALQQKISHDIGGYKQQLVRIEQQHTESQQLTTRIQEHVYAHELYQNLAQAVGKDGIQALLIEQALPEIEQEANALLEKLTDNQAHLTIESLRDLKSGKTKETLDIHISDATGIRPYEMFSGGEAFRIDFALRIALSKLLASRAGTSLQTLIIDEGFGSQDEEGLHNIMEALYKIQDHFAKIIVVSHLPYMKDQFPVHFVVNKTAQGSTIKVIEQG